MSWKKKARQSIHEPSPNSDNIYDTGSVQIVMAKAFVQHECHGEAEMIELRRKQAPA